MMIQCPLCSRESKKTYPLYGNTVCRKCATGFANRRQIAWLLDMFVLYGLNFGLGVAIGIVLLSSTGGRVTVEQSQFAEQVALGLGLLLAVIYTAKDGLAGKSLGKMLFGVTCVDEDTFQPIGFGKSMARNLIVLVPFLPLVIALVMMKGPRIGDSWAKTRVIWDKYRDSFVFNPNAAAIPNDPYVPGPAPVEDGNPFRRHRANT